MKISKNRIESISRRNNLSGIKLTIEEMLHTRGGNDNEDDGSHALLPDGVNE